MDNIFIERLWYSLKYEAVYLHELSDGFQPKEVISRWVAFYNYQRHHWALGRSAPAEAYDHGLLADTRKKPIRSTPSPPLPPEYDDVLNKTMTA